MPDMSSFIDKQLNAFMFDTDNEGNLVGFHLYFVGGISIYITLEKDSFKIARIED